MSKRKGQSEQKKREKWQREHPNMTRTEFARIKKQKRLEKRKIKLERRRQKNGKN